MAQSDIFSEYEAAIPELLPDPPTETGEQKKRGRPAKAEKSVKQATTAATKTTKKDVDLSVAINTVGAMIAGLFGRPDLMLAPDESEGLSKAANRVAGYYDLPDMGSVGAWVNLGLTIGAIVYPRYAQLQAEREQRKAEKESKAV
jgi:hypothetical protein